MARKTAATKERTEVPARHKLSQQLREVIAERKLTAYELGKKAGVDAGVIQRFLNEERDLRMETADRLGHALGLRLVEKERGLGRGRPRVGRAAEESGD